jgi:hypothetical protein
MPISNEYFKHLSERLLILRTHLDTIKKMDPESLPIQQVVRLMRLRTERLIYAHETALDRARSASFSQQLSEAPELKIPLEREPMLK